MTPADTRDPPRDEFYIGYDPPMPVRMATRVWRVATATAGIAVAVAVTAIATHHRLAEATFEYGSPQELSGVLHRTPYSRIEIDGRNAWLVGRGKTGGEAALAEVPDGAVKLHGTLIERGPHRMFEVVPGTITSIGAGGAADPAAAPPRGEDVTLHGEIVDSKCFLGVMNPGEGTVHRDCARVCLRGGIPPMLLIRGARGEEALVLLVDDAGAPVGRALATLAGVPVQVHGRLVRDGGQMTLFADATSFSRLR
jgi:hypothetical protein